MNTKIHSVFSVSTSDRVPISKKKFVVASQTLTTHSHQIDIPIDPFPLNSSPNHSLVPQFFVIHAYIRVLAFRDISLQELMNMGLVGFLKEMIGWGFNLSTMMQYLCNKRKKNLVE